MWNLQGPEEPSSDFIFHYEFRILDIGMQTLTSWPLTPAEADKTRLVVIGAHTLIPAYAVKACTDWRDSHTKAVCTNPSKLWETDFTITHTHTYASGDKRMRLLTEVYINTVESVWLISASFSAACLTPPAENNQCHESLSDSLSPPVSRLSFQTHYSKSNVSQHFKRRCSDLLCKLVSSWVPVQESFPSIVVVINSIKAYQMKRSGRKWWIPAVCIVLYSFCINRTHSRCIKTTWMENCNTAKLSD